MEFHILKRLFEDKQIMNPLNPEEVFTCKDLIDGMCQSYFDLDSNIL